MDRSPQDDVPAPNPWVDLRDDGPAGRNLTHVELPVVDVFGPPSPRIGRRRGVSVRSASHGSKHGGDELGFGAPIGLEQSGLSPDVGGRSESGWEIVQLNARNGELSSEIAVTCKHSRGVLRVEPRRQLEALLSRAPHHSQAYRKYCELPSAAALKRDEFGPLSGLPGASWAAEVAEVWAGSPARSPATLGASQTAAWSGRRHANVGLKRRPSERRRVHRERQGCVKEQGAPRGSQQRQSAKVLGIIASGGSDLEHPRADRQRPCRGRLSRAATRAAHRRPRRRHPEQGEPVQAKRHPAARQRSVEHQQGAFEKTARPAKPRHLHNA